MSCGGNNGWLLDYGLVEEDIQGSEFIYMVDDPPVSRWVFFSTPHQFCSALLFVSSEDWMVEITDGCSARCWCLIRWFVLQRDIGI
jgi:hypothetical protein